MKNSLRVKTEVSGGMTWNRLCLSGLVMLCSVFPSMTAWGMIFPLSQDHESSRSKDSGAQVVRQLTHRDPLARQSAAEDLARLALPEQRRLVEGYRVQEKDARVQLALDWALYRMGKMETIFNLVRALDSSRSQQALFYLTQLETPEPLYLFLAQVNGNTQIKLLQVLAHIGDAETLERIKSLHAALDPLVAEAAKTASQDISARLAEPASSAPGTSRPRKVSASVEPELEETAP